MPSRHSKNATDKHHFTYHEKKKAGFGAAKQRLGVESQLPFGYCSLSLRPAEDPVISPSGHLYSRESILEYLLEKSKELKIARTQYEEQQVHRKILVFSYPLLFYHLETIRIRRKNPGSGKEESNCENVH
jgi:nitric oxide synthase-interacting protein